MQQWPAHRAKEQLQQEIRQQWIDALRQRGDLRSRATALFLAADSDANASARALTALARSHADPYVAALAGQQVQACKRLASCTTLAPEERLTKDPGNLSALLEAYDRSPELLPRLAALLPQRPDYRSYSAELLQILLSLPAAPQEGLRREVELALLMRLQGRWLSPAFSAAMHACKMPAPADHPAQGNTCSMLAQTLWDQGESLLDRDMSLAVAKAAGLDERAPWPSRRAELDALRRQHLAQLEQLAPSDPSTGNACLWQERFRTYLEVLAQYGELRASRDWKRAPNRSTP